MHILPSASAHPNKFIRQKYLLGRGGKKVITVTSNWILCASIGSWNTNTISFIVFTSKI